MKCLVLGADGFIGSHLVDDLLSRGHEVRAFDRFRDGQSFNLQHLRNKIEFFAGDFLNLDDLECALSGIEVVFHMISFSTPISSLRDPLLDINTNLGGTVNLLDLCVKKGVKKVFFPSSGGTVYGDIDIDLIPEGCPTNPVCPYAISKLAIEKYLQYFHKLYGLDYLIFRISNPYGERQNIKGNQGVIPIFLNLIMNDKPVKIYGDGENVRDYVYVKDVTGLIADAIFKKTKDHVYNVGSGEGCSVNYLVSLMQKITGQEVNVDRQETRGSDLKKVILDISKVRNEFGFKLTVDIEDGMKKMWDYINT